MAGIVGDSEEHGGSAGPDEAAAGQCPMTGGQDPATPGENGDQIEIAQMDEEDVAEAKRQPCQQRGGPAAAERARKRVNTQPRPPEMADAEQLHPAIVEVGI